MIYSGPFIKTDAQVWGAVIVVSIFNIIVFQLIQSDFSVENIFFHNAAKCKACSLYQILNIIERIVLKVTEYCKYQILLRIINHKWQQAILLFLYASRLVQIVTRLYQNGDKRYMFPFFQL